MTATLLQLLSIRAGHPSTGRFREIIIFQQLCLHNPERVCRARHYNQPIGSHFQREKLQIPKSKFGQTSKNQKDNLIFIIFKNATISGVSLTKPVPFNHKATVHVELGSPNLSVS